MGGRFFCVIFLAVLKLCLYCTTKHTNKHTMYYILKTTTEQTYCPIENKFFDATWEPIDEERHVLESIMQDDPKRFENCKIVQA